MSIKTSTLAACLATCLSGTAMAGSMLNLMLAPNGGAAELVFLDDMTASDAFMIRLTGIAVPGSRVKISIDRDTRALIDVIVAPGTCRFGDTPVVCMVPVKGGTAQFAGLVQAFKAGLVAHLEITNAGFEAMTSDTSLVGFTRSFEAL